MDLKADKVPRFTLFKRVLSEAAKSPPLSPAFHAYKAASSDAERRDAYAAMTGADRDALIEEATGLIRARDEAAVAELRAADAKFASWNANRLAILRTAEATRIASLPAASRHRARIRSTTLPIASRIGNSLGWLLVSIFIFGNIVSFALSLIYQWSVWLLLAGTCFAIYAVVILAAHWRKIISILKALPAAMSAAIYGDRSRQESKAAPNSAAPADQKAPFPGR